MTKSLRQKIATGVGLAGLVFGVASIPACSLGAYGFGKSFDVKILQSESEKIEEEWVVKGKDGVLYYYELQGEKEYLDGSRSYIYKLVRKEESKKE